MSSGRYLLRISFSLLNNRVVSTISAAMDATRESAESTYQMAAGDSPAGVS